MKLLLLFNTVPGVVRSAISGKKEAARNWMDAAVDSLRQNPEVKLRLLCLGNGFTEGKIDGNLSFGLFPCKKNWRKAPELEPLFKNQLEEFRPDVIHIWGTEYPHTLAMVRVCRECDFLERTVISIQGLCSACALCYTSGLPAHVVYGFTLRDVLRMDNVRQQQKKFALRGKNELEALKLARHVIGRTPWDYALTEKANPDRQYHFCNETLRAPFYGGAWRYAGCTRHRIFASSCVYPIKGFHFLMEAAAQAAKIYPDLTIAVPGKSFLNLSGKERLREDWYHRYLRKLAEQYGLEHKITFLGNCSAEEMKAAFLDANVFVLPSTAENSPNSLGEAMLLGVPCVASDVGGVSTLMQSGQEGLVVPSADSAALADAICRVFALEDQAEAMGRAAHNHAAVTHDPEKNLTDLLAIYRRLQAD